MRFTPLTAVALLTLAAPVAVRAQSARAASRDTGITIPKAMMPPAGKCRIWMPGVPASQQPAATDCTTALRQRPANGILVFGPAKRDLSPFDVRNPWGPAGSEARRGTTARGDTTSRSYRAGRSGRAEPAPTTTARQIPSTQTAPAAREAPPARKNPPPAKKPEKP